MPLLGFTTYQKNFFLVVFGAVLVALSFSNSISKRKAVPKVRKQKKEMPSSVFIDGHGTLASELEKKDEPIASVSENKENSSQPEEETAQS